eukprot:3661808-Lingulodinium_polyedra.AAC.1
MTSRASTMVKEKGNSRALRAKANSRALRARARRASSSPATIITWSLLCPPRHLWVPLVGKDSLAGTSSLDSRNLRKDDCRRQRSQSSGLLDPGPRTSRHSQARN